MTMLDRMRRHRGWLKWSLALWSSRLCCSTSPVSCATAPQGAAGNSVVADVEGREITAAQFRRVYQQQMQAYRQSYGANVDDKLLKQLGIDQRIVQQMIQEEASLAEAARLGHQGERRRGARAHPGAAGVPGERPVHRRPALPPAPPDAVAADAPRRVRGPGPPQHRRREAAGGADRLDDRRRRATSSTSSSSATSRSRSQVVNFPADKFREGLVATDAEVAKHFEDHKESLPDRREAQGPLPDDRPGSAARSRPRSPASRSSAPTTTTSSSTSTPEQVRASHILLKTEGKDDAAVKKQAEDLLAQIKKGANFEELAKKNSQDEGSAVKGGDLDFFGKGRMVPEFDKAAFALPARPDQRPRQVAVRLPHHQGHRQEAGDARRRWPRCGRKSRTS